MKKIVSKITLLLGILLIFTSCSTNRIDIDDDLIKAENEFYDALKENERGIVEYVTKGIFKESATGSSRYSSISVNDVNSVIERAKLSNIEIYLPEFIPEGYEMVSSNIWYYISDKCFDKSKGVKRVEKIEDLGTFYVFELDDNYGEFIDNIYIDYENMEGKSYRYDYRLDWNNDGEKVNPKDIKKESLVDISKIDNENNYSIGLSIDPIKYYQNFSISGLTLQNQEEYKGISLKITSDDLNKDDIENILTSIEKVS